MASGENLVLILKLFDFKDAEIANLMGRSDSMRNVIEAIAAQMKLIQTENERMREMIHKLSMNAIEVGEYLRKLQAMVESKADEIDFGNVSFDEPPPLKPFRRLDDFLDGIE